MTSQTSKYRFGLRRALTGAVASSALALGLLMGSGPATANADILDDIGTKYMHGMSGGQISNWVKESLQLRAMGFRPSNANLEALQAGWDYLPNQVRLVDALKETVTYQRTLQARAANVRVPSGPTAAGIDQLLPGMAPAPANAGILIGPGGGIVQPIG